MIRSRPASPKCGVQRRGSGGPSARDVRPNGGNIRGALRDSFDSGKSAPPTSLPCRIRKPSPRDAFHPRSPQIQIPFLENRARLRLSFRSHELTTETIASPENIRQHRSNLRGSMDYSAALSLIGTSTLQLQLAKPALARPFPAEQVKARRTLSLVCATGQPISYQQPQCVRSPAFR